ESQSNEDATVHAAIRARPRTPGNGQEQGERGAREGSPARLAVVLRDRPRDEVRTRASGRPCVVRLVAILRLDDIGENERTTRKRTIQGSPYARGHAHRCYLPQQLGANIALEARPQNHQSA